MGYAIHTGGRDTLSVNENMIFLSDVEHFTQPMGEFIALEVAKGAGLAELHELHPDRVPNPIIVNRWARKFPAFGVLMEEAEVAAAQGMAYDTVRIADGEKHSGKTAAEVSNMVKARQWLASKMADKYSNTPPKESGVTINGDVVLTDAQLMAIASGGLTALEGESARLERRVERVVTVDEAEPVNLEPDPDPDPDPWDF